MEEKQRLENELIKLDSKLKEEQEKNRSLQAQIDQEIGMKEEFNKNA